MILGKEYVILSIKSIFFWLNNNIIFILMTVYNFFFVTLPQLTTIKESP